MPSRLSVPPSEEILGKLSKVHPRLLLTKEILNRIKNQVQSDEKSKSWFMCLHSDAQKLLLQRPLRYEIPDGLRLLHVSRGVQERVYTLALVFSLTSDRRYAERAWQELESASNFQDWNPRHFLDTAEMTHAFAIGYDWLYDAWDDGQREVLRDAIIEKGLIPALECYNGKAFFGWWVKSKHNWNQVCNGGIGIGALAVADERPDIALEIIRNALRSIQDAMQGFAPDGGWAEGPGYWAYATFYNVVFIESLSTALGTDFGLSKFDGFSETGLFPIYMTGPIGMVFNFADCHEKLGNVPQMLWFAKRFGCATCARYETRMQRPHPLDLLWLGAGYEDSKDKIMPLDKYFKSVEVATMRSSWDDENALFVAFKAGDNKANHSNLDCGTFVLDALGYRWAIDLGPDNYNLPGYFGTERWKYYRMRSEGHNTLVIDPSRDADQNPNAKTHIVRFESSFEKAFAIADLTAAYEASARSVLRGIAMLGRKKVVVQDEIETKNLSHVWWFMHTRAKIELNKDRDEARLTQGDANLSARIVSPKGARFDVMDAAPLSTSPNPEGQERNEGVRKLVIHLGGVTNAHIAILLVPFRGGEDLPSELMKTNRLDKW